MAVVKKTLPSAPPKKALKRATVDSLKEFKLSTDYTEPSDNLQDYSILLFGEKKIGKTKLTSLFPDTYFIKPEEGTKGVRVRGDRPENWRMFRRMVTLLRKDKSRTVGVDTIDLLYQMCVDFVCHDLGIDHPSEAAYGKGWAAVRKEFTDGMQKLMGMGKGVILISHATEGEIKTRTGDSYNRVHPTMAGQARDICEAIVDIWAYFHYEDDRRVLTILGDEHISAGHRLDERFRWNGKQVRHIEMTDDPATGLANFRACFNNKYQPASGGLVEPEKPKKLVVKKRKLAKA